MFSACSGGGREPRPDGAAAPRSAVSRRPMVAHPLINLPAALALRSAGFHSRFGPPRPAEAGFVDPGKELLADRRGGADSVAWFEPQGLPMIVSFQAGTGAVQDVLLLGADEPTLMRQAQLLPDAAGYLLLPVFEDHHAGQLLGLRVVPKYKGPALVSSN